MKQVAAPARRGSPHDRIFAWEVLRVSMSPLLIHQSRNVVAGNLQSVRYLKPRATGRTLTSLASQMRVMPLLLLWLGLMTWMLMKMMLRFGFQTRTYDESVSLSAWPSHLWSIFGCPSQLSVQQRCTRDFVVVLCVADIEQDKCGCLYKRDVHTICLYYILMISCSSKLARGLGTELLA